MNKEEIQRGNAIIAEFMGVKVHESWGTYVQATYHKRHHATRYIKNNRVLTDAEIAENKAIDDGNRYAPNLAYHYSWNELIPVILKLMTDTFMYDKWSSDARFMLHGVEWTFVNVVADIEYLNTKAQ